MSAILIRHFSARVPCAAFGGGVGPRLLPCAFAASFPSTYAARRPVTLTRCLSSSPTEPTRPPAESHPAATPAPAPAEPAAPVKETRMQKAKALFKKYGYVAIALYSTAYISQLGMSYVLLSEFNNFGFEVADLASTGRFGQYLPDALKLDPKSTSVTSNHISMLLAWVTTEMCEPVRLPLSLAVTPFVRRALDRRAGAGKAP